MDDPRWAEQARKRGVPLEKVREGLYVVKQEEKSAQDDRPSGVFEKIQKDAKEPEENDVAP